jgi:hypothetical protein
MKALFIAMVLLVVGCADAPARTWRIILVGGEQIVVEGYCSSRQVIKHGVFGNIEPAIQVTCNDGQHNIFDGIAIGIEAMQEGGVK